MLGWGLWAEYNAWLVLTLFGDIHTSNAVTFRWDEVSEEIANTQTLEKMQHTAKQHIAKAGISANNVQCVCFFWHTLPTRFFFFKHIPPFESS